MKPHTLSIDIETFSSVDLISCGVYKYVEADDFEILLFAYSCDYGAVQIVKLAEGELIPDEVLDYLYDKDVEKTAFNAAFERTCLTKALGRYCEPEQWSCTMVLAASCGLPMSLKGVGAALGLSEEKAKMKEGSDLIRYFCVPCRPTKTNGGRTRNLPIHAPDKWETFCRYNIRDVEVENTIREQLLKWRPNYSEQKLWCLDQRMNDKGVRIEPKLAENAIRIGDQYREKLIGQAKEISGLENPNSTAQIKAWLEEQEDIEVLSLNKKAIANVYSQLSADETKAVLQLREEFSKSSNKKYEAFLRSCCKDNHVRGTFQFYGASTGRWCLTGDHEVLTPDGWVRLDEWDGGMIACWNMQQEGLSFQKSKALEFDYSGEMLVIDSQECAQISTPDHKMAYTSEGQYPWRIATMAELYGKQFNIPSTRIPGGYMEIRPEHQSKIDYYGKVYCASTPAGFFLVRRDRRVWITGNSGRLVQLQNLPHDTLPDLDDARMLALLGDEEDFECMYPKVQSALSALIRTMIIPEDGQILAVADFSAIEARVIAWLANEEWRLEAFSTGKDIYCESASRAFGIPVEKHGQNSEYRKYGKVIELACGYGGSTGAMLNFGADKLGMTEEQMVDLVDKWRDASPHIVAFWKSLESAAIKCIQRKMSTISVTGAIRFDFEDGVLWMNLPSGRRIAYWGAEMGKDRWGRPSLTYMTQNQTTKKWERTETFGGKLVENCIQATARDCLKEALFNLDKAGYDVRATVHDEVIITAPMKDGMLDEIIALMCKGAPWTKGLPLNADGYLCTSYRKSD